MSVGKKRKLDHLRRKLAERKVRGVRSTSRHEAFHVRHVRRTYDKDKGKFFFNISYQTAVKLTKRSLAVAEAFGLGIDEERKFTVLETELKIGQGDVVYITGDSGSGKSVLLQALKQVLGNEAVDIADIQIDHDKPLIETVGATAEEALELLSRVGLNDAFLFLRTYDQLSDGQRYRYRVAKLLECGKPWWILDEFAATLDRDTAKIVAFNLQRLSRQQNKTVSTATTHTDLSEDLNPSVHVHKRFGKEITVNYRSNEPAKECSLVKEMRIEEGTTKDWQELAFFHYRSHRIAAPRKIFCLKRSNELCGVIVYCFPPSTSFGRRLVLPNMPMRELNKKLSSISRVVVHPKYRTIGLGSKLVQETLHLAGTEYVEMSAVMAKYYPFAEKAGMKKIIEQKPPKEALGILATLQGLGFNDQLLRNEKCVLEKMQTLSNEEIERIKQTSVKYTHPRFMKAFSYHLPFGLEEAYREQVENLNLEKLAHLIKVCGFLLQTKVYLFWSSDG